MKPSDGMCQTVTKATGSDRSGQAVGSLTSEGPTSCSGHQTSEDEVIIIIFKQ